MSSTFVFNALTRRRYVDLARTSSQHCRTR